MCRINPVRATLAALFFLLGAAVLGPEFGASRALAQDEGGDENGGDDKDGDHRRRERLERERLFNLFRIARLERERHWEIGRLLAKEGFLGFAAEYLRVAADPMSTVPSDQGFVAVNSGDLPVGERAYRLLAEIEQARGLPRRALERADAQVREGQPAAAYRTLLRAFRISAPNSALAPALAEATARVERLEERAEAHLEHAFRALDEWDVEALGMLLDEGRENWQEFQGFVGAGLAWRRLVNDPRVKALLREREAAEAWENAARMAAARPGVRAFEAVQSVARRYPETPAGKEAAERLDRLHEDADFMAAVDAERARSLFVRAENYRRSQLHDRAAELYREYIERFPDGADAAAARQALGGLPRQE